MFGTKNIEYKNILVPKKFWVQKDIGSSEIKILGKQKIGYKKVSLSKFCVKKIVAPEMFWSKIL